MHRLCPQAEIAGDWRARGELRGRADAFGGRQAAGSFPESPVAVVDRIAAGKAAHGHDPPVSGRPHAGGNRHRDGHAGADGEESFAAFTRDVA